MGYKLRIKKNPLETEEHYLLKVATVNELIRRGYSIDDIVLEKYYRNMDKTFLTSEYFGGDKARIEKVGREKLVFHGCFSKSFIDVILQSPLVFFECLTKFPMLSQWHHKIKSLELCALTNKAKLVFVLPTERKSFRKLDGIFVDGVWLVNLREKKVEKKFGWK